MMFLSRSSAETGIDFANDLQDTGDLNIIEYLYYYNGAGVAVGDINNDGLADIYFSGNQRPDALYLNLGDFRFQNISESSGIGEDTAWSNGAVMADVNGDGFLDIYVCKVGKYKSLQGHNLLYLNNGDQTFSEVSQQVGLDFSGFSTSASFFDYDRDGDLDMYLLNHAVHTARSYRPASTREEVDPLAGDRLYENKLTEGQFRFEDVTLQAGIYSSSQGYGLGLVTSDINQDGWMDIYVGNDFHEDDYLYINQGNGTFKEDLKQYINHTSRFTMGVDIADIDGDNLFDVFTLDMLPREQQILMKSGGEDNEKVSKAKLNFGYGYQYARNAFQLNRENRFFSEVALYTETYATDWSWSVLLQDFDNDGLSDIFITNGIYKRPNDLDYINFLSNFNFGLYDQAKQDKVERELIEGMPTLKIPNYLFHNQGKLKFREVSSEWGLGEPSYSNGAMYADLDNDGDLDLVINNVNSPASVYENRAGQLLNHHFLQVRLLGDSLNASAIGAKVQIWIAGEAVTKEVLSARGFQSSPSSVLHFGLGGDNFVDSMLVQWPDGALQRAFSLAGDTLHTIRKGATYNHDFYTRDQQMKLSYVNVEHKENSYRDYNKEHLIPERLSTEGPGAVVADFDGDKLDDLFIGGGRGQHSQLLMGTMDGFQKKEVPDFAMSRDFEDIDAVSFDFDNDGDFDLYVARGGNDYPEGSPFLQDVLYLNDGKANFVRSGIHLPAVNGSCIAAEDYDKDGYTDVFIGSRSVPGAYGVSPYSFLLQNENGQSFRVAQEWPVGMVADAVWLDYDQDGFKDLFVVGDWMPVTVLKNAGGAAFTDRTAELGLHQTHGLWNSIETSDLNCDGRGDLIVGNLGLNSKLKASKNQPVSLYLDDFDQNGQLDPIIFYYKNGENIPFASRDELSEQMPYLKKAFLSYQEFAKVRSIEHLTGKKKDQINTVKQLYELRSSVFLYEDNRFIHESFPSLSQLSPVNSTLVIDDLDMDGSKEVLYVGNFFASRTALGRYDASAGGILSINCGGKLKFEAFMPLDFDKEYRQVFSLNKDKFMFIPNSGHPILVERNDFLKFLRPEGTGNFENVSIKRYD